MPAALVPLAFVSGLRPIPFLALWQWQASGLSVRQACSPGGRPRQFSVRSLSAAVRVSIGSRCPCFLPLSPGWLVQVPRLSAWALLLPAAWPSWLAVNGPGRPWGRRPPFSLPWTAVATQVPPRGSPLGGSSRHPLPLIGVKVATQPLAVNEIIKNEWLGLGGSLNHKYLAAISLFLALILLCTPSKPAFL